MPKSYDLIGKRFGRLVVTAMAARKPGERIIRWSCLCDCGNITQAPTGGLNFGHPRSCGCGQRDAAAKVCIDKSVHAMSGKRIYNIWRAMHQRCYYPRAINYQCYGARGISICKERYKNFPVFYAWAMANGYKEWLSIDRINNNGNYEPSNCRFIGPKSQARNRKNTRLLTLDGITKSVVEWAELSGIGATTILYRISAGWPSDKLLALARAYGRTV